MDDAEKPVMLEVMTGPAQEQGIPFTPLATFPLKSSQIRLRI
jgi:hypothetical protein